MQILDLTSIIALNELLMPTTLIHMKLVEVKEILTDTSVLDIDLPTKFFWKVQTMATAGLHSYPPISQAVPNRELGGGGFSGSAAPLSRWNSTAAPLAKTYSDK